jgi:hypothetical protein
VTASWVREDSGAVDDAADELVHRHIHVAASSGGLAEAVRSIVVACNDPAGFGTLVELDGLLGARGLRETRELLRGLLQSRPYDPVNLHEAVVGQLTRLRSQLRQRIPSSEAEALLERAVRRAWPGNGKDLPTLPPRRNSWAGLEWLAAQNWRSFTQVLDLLVRDGNAPGLAAIAREHFRCDYPLQDRRPIRTHLVVRIAGQAMGRGEPRFDVRVRLFELAESADGQRLEEVRDLTDPELVDADGLRETVATHIGRVAHAIDDTLAWADERTQCRQVEFLLDTAALDLDVDQWKVKIGTGRPQPIGYLAPVVVRSLERMLWPGGIDVVAWRRRSQRMSDGGEARWAVADGAASGPDEISLQEDLDELERSLLQLDDGVVCLGLDDGRAPDTKAGGVLDCMVHAGLPILAWSRGSGLEPLRKLMQPSPGSYEWRLLPAELHRIRLHDGVQISMLWDDEAENWETNRDPNHGTVQQTGA